MSARLTRGEALVGQVIIGMDPHKRSATIEIIDSRETVLAGGRFGTDRCGYKAMLALGRRYPERIRAVEGATALAGTSPSGLSPMAKS
jgi:transposase